MDLRKHEIDRDPSFERGGLALGGPVHAWVIIMTRDDVPLGGMRVRQGLSDFLTRGHRAGVGRVVTLALAAALTRLARRCRHPPLGEHFGDGGARDGAARKMNHCGLSCLNP